MSRKNEQAYRILDPVHGLIVFGRSGDRHLDETDMIAWELLNTAEFQRLRRIRQLGFAELVFPGATHNRFAHSIGVYHMARQLVEIIARRQDSRDPDRERITLLAALLHDVGHGPFSHAFELVSEKVGPCRRHERWSVEIVQGDTEVNRVLRSVDGELPQRIGELLADGKPEDVYGTIVSSQFDADRLDYIQRDRLMTGVRFGYIDLDWLFDCLEVGKITYGKDDPVEASCFYFGPKGMQVAEEYLEARFRLYRTVYMHKTTRAAERMLQALLGKVASGMQGDQQARHEPVMRYLTSRAPTLGDYLALDDSRILIALSTYSKHDDPGISELARRLVARDLYRCVDISVHGSQVDNKYARFRKELKEADLEWENEILFDNATLSPYEWYNFDDSSALNKVLVKSRIDQDEPEDIMGVSEAVKALGRKDFQRAYAPDADKAEKLREILRKTRW